MRISYLWTDFKVKKCFCSKTAQTATEYNRHMDYYTPLGAIISVFGSVTVWSSTGESTVNSTGSNTIPFEEVDG